MSQHPYTRLFVKTTAPTVSDDSSAGYEVGDFWIDTVGENSYHAATITVGSAKWLREIDNDGWMPVTATWTRTGNFTFTITGDVTATYRKGTKVRYKDGGSYEYGVVGSSSYSAPNTTVTLITNSNYAMAAATITDTYLSYTETPEGFPRYFDYTPTYSASGSMTYTSVGTTFATWTTKGPTIFVRLIADGTTGGTASITLFATAPITEASNSTGAMQPGSYSEGGAGLLGYSFVFSGLIGVRKADASNYGLGAGRTMNANVNYEF
jgi:hypothetical protein